MGRIKKNIQTTKRTQIIMFTQMRYIHGFFFLIFLNGRNFSSAYKLYTKVATAQLKRGLLDNVRTTLTSIRSERLDTPHQSVHLKQRPLKVLNANARL